MYGIPGSEGTMLNSIDHMRLMSHHCLLVSFALRLLCKELKQSTKLSCGYLPKRTSQMRELESAGNFIGFKLAVLIRLIHTVMQNLVRLVQKKNFHH